MPLWQEPIPFDWEWSLDGGGGGGEILTEDVGPSDRDGDAIVLVPIDAALGEAAHSPPNPPPAKRGVLTSWLSGTAPLTHPLGYAATRVDTATRGGEIKSIRPGTYELHYYLWDGVVGKYHPHHVPMEPPLVVAGPTLTLPADPQPDLGIDPTTLTRRMEKGYFCGDPIRFKIATSATHDVRDEVALCLVSPTGVLEVKSKTPVGSELSTELIFEGDSAPQCKGTYVLQYLEFVV
jgi:hypothetical protein